MAPKQTARKPAAEAPKYRVVELRKKGEVELTYEKPDGARGLGEPFTGCVSNEVHTSKYTLTNFVCKIAFEQLRRGVNLYFLFSCLLMFIGHNTSFYVGTIKASSTFMVLVMMMSISAVVSIADDLNRRKADGIMNAQKTKKYDLKSTAKDPLPLTWKDVKVGDLLYIQQDEEVPADGIALCCSSDEGFLYVSTSSLDGETSLKLQVCLPLADILGMKSISGDQAIKALKDVGSLSVTAEPPNPSIYSFNGNLKYGDKVQSIIKSNFVLRGSKLKNTKWAVILVTYVGNDTRIMKNTSKPPSKLSHLESVNNKAMLVTALAQAVIALVSDIMHSLNEERFLSYWYIFPTGEPEAITFPPFIAWWFSFFTLYSNMVPVSLYSTMEIVNFFQARSIKIDSTMVSGGNTAKVRSTNLCQEIGQVTHIFSDKTGTLTKNQMTARVLCTIDERGKTEAYPLATHTAVLKKAVESASPAQELVKALSVAHTVMVAEEGGKLIYMAESPDESALVEAAADLGWPLHDRKGNTVYIRKQPAFTVIATNAFSSSRGCMSVLVEYKKEFILYVKGSDTVMLEKCGSKTQNRAPIEQKLNELAKEGLRTLLVGMRKLSQSEADSFAKAYNAAGASKDRDNQLATVAAGVEKDLTLVGITAIEDELQDNVGETIEKIRQAGISLWVLTGDKLETAKTIGYSTKVLREKTVITEITGSATKEQFEDIVKMRELEKNKYKESILRKTSPPPITETALMITGQALTSIVKDAALKQSFLNAANACTVVIACRVAPYQKAELVDMVRYEKKRDDDASPNRVTLAVGDGANDVPMIQRAEVGVGIYGREGHQAVNSADFAIGEFQFLQKLLLVHGRWNYRRTCKFIAYTFWRCIVQVLLCFYFTFYCGFAATILFHDNIRLSFNVVLAPVICAVGCFDRDVAAQFVLDRPALYAPGPRDDDLNPMRMLQQLLSATAHSIFIWVVMIFAFPNLDILQSGDLYTFGTAVWTVLIVDCQLRGIFLTITWTAWNFLAVVASSLGYLFLIRMWCKSTSTMLVGSYDYMFNTVFVIAGFAASMLGLCFDLLVESTRIKYFPEEMDNALMKGIADAKRDNKCDDEVAPDFEMDKELPKNRLYFNLLLRHNVYISNFGFWKDKKQRHFQLFHTDKTGWRVSLPTAICFGILGAWWLSVASSGAEFSQAYSGECHGKLSCNLSVTVPEAMEPPISVSFKVDPFYQNYLIYSQSYSMMELRGLDPTDTDLANCMKSPTTMSSADGKDFVPCGLIAASLFNDTFSFTVSDTELVVDSEGIARSSEVDTKDSLFQNPPDYGANSSKEWLYERYPDVVSKEKGVRDEHFAVWNRIGALDYARKPLGRLQKKLQKGQTLNIAIANNFNPGPEATKSLVFTKETTLGGSDKRLGYLLIVASVLLLCASVYEFTAKQNTVTQTAEQAVLFRAAPSERVEGRAAAAERDFSLSQPLLE